MPLESKETINRRAKVEAIADRLAFIAETTPEFQDAFPWEYAAAMDSNHWAQVAKAFGMKHVSQDTIYQVIGVLAYRAAAVKGAQ